MLRMSPLLKLLALLPALLLAAPGANAEGMTIAHPVVKLPLEDGVSRDAAVHSMKLHANAPNFKLVSGDL